MGEAWSTERSPRSSVIVRRIAITRTIFWCLVPVCISNRTLNPIFRSLRDIASLRVVLWAMATITSCPSALRFPVTFDSLLCFSTPAIVICRNVYLHFTFKVTILGVNSAVNEELSSFLDPEIANSEE